MTGLRLYPWLLVLGLSACATAPVVHSVADADPLRRAVVEDVVLGVGEVFAPGLTPLAPVRAPGGAFDNALYAALRAKGYTVLAVGGKGTAFDCAVDPIGGALYRVKLRVGATTMSRLWVLKGSDAYTGGAWARRE
jgi:hypothetical protein